MSKIASYLGGHLRGEVMTGVQLRDHYATDGSILKITPLLVAYPFHTADVRKIAHFAWQLAEKGHILALTARGSGSSTVGAAIGAGAIVSTPKHMKSIREIDTKQKLARVQPGVRMQTLQETMYTHGLIWPVGPSAGHGTVGSAVANNLFSSFGGKYGSAASWVDQLEIVVASGDCLQIGPLNKRELGKKKGLANVEGEIYRQIDGLISDHGETIERLSHQPGSAGYALSQVKTKKGGINLIPLIAGSQGTLGIITELILRLDAYHPNIEVVAAAISSLDELESTVAGLQKLEPLGLEFIDSTSLEHAELAGASFKELIAGEAGLPAGLLLVEFNDMGRKAKVKAKKAARLLDKAGYFVVKSDGDFEAAKDIWQIYRRIISTLTVGEHDTKTAPPLIEDAIIPLHEATAFFSEVAALAKQQRAKIMTWGHIGTGVMHARPLLNLRHLSDKQKIDKLVSNYYKLITKLGGGIAGEYGEGRLRAGQMSTQFDESELKLFAEVKKIFDSHGIFNPGVKAVDSLTKPSQLLSDSFNPAKHSD